jgi:YfiH family protein
MTRAEYLESPLLRAAGFRHAFYTRHGGVSEGPYSSLNVSFTVGDTDDRVIENLARAAAGLGVSPARLYFLTQVHGSRVRVLSGDEDATQVRGKSGDAVASRCPGLACCVRVADCVPILLGDRQSGAAAAVHAGWRGTVAGIVGAAVGRLCDLSGTEARPIAAIGPHISARAFEVSEEVAAQLLAASSATDVVDRSRGGRPHVALRRIIRAQLRDAGLPDEEIDDVAGCTVSEPGRFFSYRRDGKRSGRHLAGIVPCGPAPLRRTD